MLMTSLTNGEVAIHQVTVIILKDVHSKTHVMVLHYKSHFVLVSVINGSGVKNGYDSKIAKSESEI